MTDTRKDFEDAMKVLPEFRLGDFYVFSGMSAQWRAWQACQSLNDKRIQQLLAVIAKKDEALRLITCDFDSSVEFKSDGIPYAVKHVCAQALAIKPEDVELVEVCSYIDPRDGQTKPAYTIKTKE